MLRKELWQSRILRLCSNTLLAAALLFVAAAGIAAVVFRGHSSILIGETTFLWISPYAFLAAAAPLLAAAGILRILARRTAAPAPGRQPGS